jgi:archaellum biogenesis ATPase FlaH
MESKAKMVIVDSLGLAAGNDLREQPTATAFFLGLRQLGITSLIITHVSKDTLAQVVRIRFHIVTILQFDHKSKWILL